MNFENQLALITGGSSGIGLALSKKLAAQGAHVFILARDPVKMDAACQEINAARRSPSQKVGMLWPSSEPRPAETGPSTPLRRISSASEASGFLVGPPVFKTGVMARAVRRVRFPIGSNIIMVLPGSLTAGGMRLGAGATVTLTEDDAKAIAAECPAVSAAAPVVRNGAQVMYGNNNWATSIQGTTPGYLVIRDATLSAGRPFTDQDVDSAAKVAVLGQTVVRNLFDSGDPVGQIVRIKNVPFKVVGVLERKGGQFALLARMPEDPSQN